MKRTWEIETEQNGGEYVGRVWIEAETVTQIDSTIIVADGVQITFDEPILSVDGEVAKTK